MYLTVDRGRCFPFAPVLATGPPGAVASLLIVQWVLQWCHPCWISWARKFPNSEPTGVGVLVEQARPLLGRGDDEGDTAPVAEENNTTALLDIVSEI